MRLSGPPGGTVFKTMSSLMLASMLGFVANAADPAASSLVGTWLLQKVECSTGPTVSPSIAAGQYQTKLQEMIIIAENGEFSRFTKLFVQYTQQGEKLARAALVTLQKKVDNAPTPQKKEQAIVNFQKMLAQYDSLALGKECLVSMTGKQSVKNAKLVLEAQEVSSDCPVIPAPTKVETAYQLTATELKFTKDKDAATCKVKDDSSTAHFNRL